MTDSKFDVDALIAERSTTHGDYMVNSAITWRIKDALHMGSRYNEMHPAMKETLDMVAHKMHRIVNGDPFFKDHWVDMTGYPHLVVGNWDRLVRWHRDEQMRSAGVEIVRTSERIASDENDVLRRLLSEAGFTIRYVDGKVAALQHGPTPAQEQIRRDLAAREAPASPLERSPDRPEPAPARVVAPADTGVAMTTRIADAGGPIVLSADEDLPMPSTVLRQPISATDKEYQDFKFLQIRGGSMIHKSWIVLYSVTSDDEGRWVMLEKYRDEYGC